jgi:hypothetical protein
VLWSIENGFFLDSSLLTVRARDCWPECLGPYSDFIDHGWGFIAAKWDGSTFASVCIIIPAAIVFSSQSCTVETVCSSKSNVVVIVVAVSILLFLFFFFFVIIVPHLVVVFFSGLLCFVITNIWFNYARNAVELVARTDRRALRANTVQ